MVGIEAGHMFDQASQTSFWRSSLKILLVAFLPKALLSSREIMDCRPSTWKLCQSLQPQAMVLSHRWEGDLRALLGSGVGSEFEFEIA